MFTDYFEIKTHEQYSDGFVCRARERAYNKKQLEEKLKALYLDCKKAEENGHKLYCVDVWHHVQTGIGPFLFKDLHEIVFHWDCYKK